MRLLPKVFRRKRKKWLTRGLVVESRKRIKYLLFFVLLIILLHTFAMMIFEGFSFGDSLWLSLTTINTTGYGDLSSTTFTGRLVTVILMYILGITLMAQLATEYIEFRIEKRTRKLKGLWKWDEMKEHIVIINTPKQNPELYLERLCKQLRITPKFEQTPICIISDRFKSGLPQKLIDSNVVYVHGDPRELEVLERSNIDTAKHIVLISTDSSVTTSDSITIDLLYQLSNLNVQGDIIAESVKDSNRERFVQLGAKSVIRPIRAYPELIARALEAPGTEEFLEDLFSHQGDKPIRYDHPFNVNTWSELACGIIQANMGTPVGYVDQQGKVRTNPPPHRSAAGQAVLMLVHEDHIPHINDLSSTINRVTQEV